MKILVVGTTGGTGREVVKQALARGHAVTAMVRRPRKLQLSHEYLTVLQGDVLDHESLRQSVAGQDAVICALGHKRWLYPNRVLSDGTRNLLEAMEGQQVRRFVCETSLGLGESFGRMGLYYTLFVIPFILPFYFWDKRRQEALIRSSSLDWTIVRPGALNHRRGRGVYEHGAGIGSWILTVGISRADVADFMLNQLSDDTYLRQAAGLSW